MFDIKFNEKGEILLIGRFDASQMEKAKSVFDTVNTTAIVNFKDLDYISSAGLSVLLATQKRLMESGNHLKLIQMNKHIRDVFKYAGFDMIFDIK